ncbi:hypothetical protein E1J23_22820, partial [Xanthomonas gardneri]|nr:hypothetical protein [Xanthomonas hortorum pv. gardneri]
MRVSHHVIVRQHIHHQHREALGAAERQADSQILRPFQAAIRYARCSLLAARCSLLAARCSLLA